MPFDNAEVSVFVEVGTLCGNGLKIKFEAHPLRIDTYAGMYDSNDLSVGATYILDGALFNFLDKRNLVNFEDNRDFYYLKADKKNFVRRAFGFRLK